MKTFLAHSVLFLAVPLAASACGSPMKQYRVTSEPPGANIYVDGEKRGQTNAERLNVAFRGKRVVTLRLEKEGYQPEGEKLSLYDTENEVFVVLKEAPNNKETLDALKRIQSLLETLPSRINENMKDKS